MDAIENVAALCAYWHSNSEGRQPEDWVVEMYRPLAEALIAAFPQLALEGREEWGVDGPWRGGPDFTAGRSESTRLSSHDNGTVPVRRMAWYEPWSEVQS